MTMENFWERVRTDYFEAVARGDHDEQCEVHPDGFWLCHCRKRTRLAKGHIEPPGELIYNYPTCPRCFEEVGHDGECFVCPRCHVQWSSTDSSDEGAYDDDYGDIATDRAEWLARRRDHSDRDPLD